MKDMMFKSKFTQGAFLLCLASYVAGAVAETVQLQGVTNAKYLDNDADGAYESDDHSPYSLSIREFSGVLSEKSLITYDFTQYANRDIESISLNGRVYGYTSSSGPILVKAFSDDVLLTPSDIFAVANNVANISTINIGLNEFSIPLDSAVIRAALQNSPYLTLRLEGNPSTNTQISSKDSTVPLTLEVAFSPLPSTPPLSDARITDVDGNGIYDELTNGPNSLSIRNFSSVKESSIALYDMSSISNSIVDAANLRLSVTGYTSSSGRVDIYGFNDDLIHEISDATHQGQYLGSFFPNSIGLGETSVNLDANSLNPLIASGQALTLRLEGPSGTNVQLGSLYSNSAPQLELSLTDVSNDTTPPVADAGPDIQVNPGTYITLEGGDSSDDTGIAKANWTQTSGEPVELYVSDELVGRFTTPYTPGTLEFELRVEDYSGNVAYDSVIVDVTDTVQYLPFGINAASIITDNDNNGIFDAIDTSPNSLNVRTFDFTEVSTARFFLDLYAGNDAQTASLDVEIGSITNNTNQVDIYAFNNGATQNLADANHPGVLLATFDPTALGLGIHSIPLDSNQLNPLLINGGTLTLRFSSNQYGANVQLSNTIENPMQLNLVVNSGGDTTPPIANAGQDLIVNAGESVELNATQSYDDVGIATYAWQQIAGTTVQQSDNNWSTNYFVAPYILAPNNEDLVFELTVIDEAGNSDVDTVTITVVGTDIESPMADAGEDQAVNQNTLVLLDATASNDNVSVETYNWVQTDGPQVALTNATTATPSFTSPDVSYGESIILTFQVTVTDLVELSNTDSVSITVTGTDQTPPTANAGPDQTVEELSIVTLDAGNSFDNAGITSYSWEQVSGTPVSLSSASSVAPTFISPDIAVGATAQLVFQITATDAAGLSSQDTVTITVEGVDSVPPTANAGSDFVVNQNENTVLSASASSDNDAITSYAWTQISGPVVALENANQVTASFISPVLGAGESAELQFEVTVTDAAGLSAADVVTVSVVANYAPIAHAGSDTTATQRQSVSLNGTFSNPVDDPIVSYQWQQISGETVYLYSASSATPTFRAPRVRGNRSIELVFELTVTDSFGHSSSDTVMITVTK